MNCTSKEVVQEVCSLTNETLSLWNFLTSCQKVCVRVSRWENSTDIRCFCCKIGITEPVVPLLICCFKYIGNFVI